MKKAIVYITSCDECPHMDRELVMHAKPEKFCELLGCNINSFDKDDNGIPIMCPLEDLVSGR